MSLLQSGAGRADAPRIRTSLHDAASLLARFATKSSFSADAHGGGRESNMNTLPFMLQMGRFLLDSVTASQRTAYQATLAVVLADDAEAAAAAAMSAAGTTPPIAPSSPLPRATSSASPAPTAVRLVCCFVRFMPTHRQALSTLSTRSSRALTEVSRRRDDGDAHRRGA